MPVLARKTFAGTVRPRELHAGQDACIRLRSARNACYQARVNRDG